MIGIKSFFLGIHWPCISTSHFRATKSHWIGDPIAQRSSIAAGGSSSGWLRICANLRPDDQGNKESRY